MAAPSTDGLGTDQLSDSERAAILVALERERRGFGLPDDFVSEATERSATCGDEVTVRVGMDGVVRWQGHGCVVSMAAASTVGGRSAAEVLAIAPAYFASVQPGGMAVDDDFEAFAGVGRFPLRGRCATLAWHAAVTAAESYLSTSSPDDRSPHSTSSAPTRTR